MSAARSSAAVAGALGGLVLGIWFGSALVKEGNPRPTVSAAVRAPAVTVEPAVEARAEEPRDPPRADRVEAPAPKPRADRVEAPAPKPRPATPPPARPAAVAVPVTAPELHERLKPVLARGTKMHLAIEGFEDAEQFATIAHAARSTNVPFVLLKHRVLVEGQTLAAAIRASRPDLDASAEVARARRAARADLASF
jgi:hypothetical protein